MKPLDPKDCRKAGCKVPMKTRTGATMKTKTPHTPTPWTVDHADKQGFYIESAGTYIAEVSSDACKEESQANAAFIVRAVNSHEELLELCRLSARVLKNLAGSEETEIYILLAHAIKKAEGE